MRCLVTGATGAVGPDVVDALLAAGHQVTILCRSVPLKHPFHDRVHVVLGDITNPVDVNRAMAEQEVVIHLAALLHVNNPSTDRQRDMARVNVEATRSLVNCAQAHGVRRFVLMSTIAVYGYNRGVVLTESTPPAPVTEYGKNKLAAERVALSIFRSDGKPLCTVLRPAAVYGPRVKGNYRTLLQALSRGRFVPIGRGENHRALIHSQDLARAVCMVLETEEAAGQVYNVSDGKEHQLDRILREMSLSLGRKPGAFYLPLPVVQFGVHLADRLGALAGRRARFGALLEKYLEDVKVSSEKISKLGFQPTIDLKLGWELTVQELQTSGQLT